eukprot:7096321-Prymnesium_polylepis.1
MRFGALVLQASRPRRGWRWRHPCRSEHGGHELLDVEQAVPVLVVLRNVRPRLRLGERLPTAWSAEDADDLVDGQSAAFVLVEGVEAGAQPGAIDGHLL